MVIEIINTGSELMLGRVLNTHAQWLCRQLADRGYVVSRQVAVPDTGPDIQGAVREALSRADLVITTGGLGPTSDDITRDLLAQLLGCKLVEDKQVLTQIQQFFDIRGRAMPASARLQALILEGAIVLNNAHGTAPGMAMRISPNPYREKKGTTWLIMLPGPPRELRPMFLDFVVELLRGELPLQESFGCRTYRTIGLGETLVQEKIAPGLELLVRDGLEIGYCARTGAVDVRLSAGGPQSQRLLDEGEVIVRTALGNSIYGVDGDEMERIVVELLTRTKRTVALAESCTGGLVSHMLTNVPGASVVVLGGFVVYSDEAKQNLLGVRAETLEANGAVSEPTARELAKGARARTKADFAVSITGIAGPGGGSEAKPVGTVFIGLAGPKGTIVQRRFNPYDRETFKQVTALQAMEMLRGAIAPV